MEQEQDVHDRDDDRLFDQRPPEGLDRPLDERRTVIKRHDLHARRQTRLKRLDLLLDPADHGDGADAVARDDDTPHRLVRPLDERCRPERIPELHVGDLAHEDGHAVLGPDDHVLQVARALDQPEAAHHRPGPARLDDVATDVTVTPHDGVDDGGERDAVAAQAARIDVDLILAYGATDARDLGHAGHRVELVADVP